MDLLNYSSNESSPLNEARRKYWSDRYMLGCATAEPQRYDVKFWLRQQSPSLANLRKVTKELRAKLPARKVYKVHMRGEASEFGFWERAHTRGQAISQVRVRYADCFDIVSVEMADV